MGNHNKGEQMASVSTYSVGNEFRVVEVAVVPPKRATSRQVRDPYEFIHNLVSRLDKKTIIPVHPSMPDVLYAGSPKAGYVLTLIHQYDGGLLEKTIDELTEASI